MASITEKTFRFISQLALPEIITIGVDIQPKHLFLVATSKKRGFAKVLSSEIYDLSEGVIKEGELKEPEVIKPLLEAFIKKLSLGKRLINSSEAVFVLSLPPNYIYTETFFVPTIDQSDLQQASRLKIETSLPWPVDKAYVDWRAIDAKDGKQTGIFISAISQPILDNFLKIFLEEGWRVGACEFHILSLARFISKEQAHSFIFVLIDEDGAEFAVFANDSLIVHHLTLKSSSEGDSFLEDKVRQLSSYAEGNFGIKIEKVFIFDKLNLQALSKNITSITGLPTQVFVPAQELDYRFSVAYGASLRSYFTNEDSINLMPPALGGRYRENLFSKSVGFLLKVTVVFVGVFLVASVGLYLFLSTQRRLIDSENVEFGLTLDRQIERSADLVNKAKDFNNIVNQAVEANGHRSAVGKKIQSVVTLLNTAGIKLLNMNSNANNEIVLMIFSDKRQGILDFQKAIHDSGVFSSINIPISELAPEKNLRVNVNLQLKQ